MKQIKFSVYFLLVISIIGLVVFNGFFDDNNNTNNETNIQEVIDYHFKNEDALLEHFNKHGKDMGFATCEEYEKAASLVVNNPNSLHKLEKEDNDDCYYLEETNEFVIVSNKGYIRTFFYPDNGKTYFDNQ